MKLSVIIAFYNETEEELLRCLNTVLKIKTIAYEILIVNDGSKNETLHNLKDHLNAIKNLRIITQENKGLSGSRNFGIRNATGDYLLMIDADDWINSSIIEKAFDKACNLKLDLIGYMHQKVNENNTFLNSPTYKSLPFNVIEKGIVFLKKYDYPVSTWSYIIKTDLIKKNELFFYPKILHEDEEHNVRLMLNAQRVQFINEIGYYYFQRENSITKPKSKEKIEKLLFDEIIVAREIKKNLDSFQPNDNIIKRSYNSIVWNLLWRFYSSPNEVSQSFKKKCLLQLKEDNLYPIKGHLKKLFQKITKPIINIKWLLNLLLKL